MTATEWRATVQLRRPAEVTTAALDTLTRALPGYGIVAHDTDAGRVRLEMTVTAPTLRLAGEAALRAAREAWTRSFGGPGEALQLRVLTVDDFDAEISQPGAEDLVGVAEIADLLAVTQQRATQLTNHPDFPHPVARLAAGPVYTRASIEAFNQRWDRKPGRPRTSG